MRCYESNLRARPVVRFTGLLQERRARARGRGCGRVRVSAGGHAGRWAETGGDIAMQKQEPG